MTRIASPWVSHVRQAVAAAGEPPTPWQWDMGESNADLPVLETSDGWQIWPWEDEIAFYNSLEETVDFRVSVKVLRYVLGVYPVKSVTL